MVKVPESIEDVLAIGSQEGLWPFEGDDSKTLTKLVAKKSERMDLDDSSKQFITELYKGLGLSFAGIYLNSKWNINIEIDSVSGEAVPVSLPGEGNRFSSLESCLLEQTAEGMRLAIPLSYRGEPTYGGLVFIKPSFSVQDMLVMRDCAYKFSNHIKNVGELPLLFHMAHVDSRTGLWNDRKFAEDYESFKSGKNRGRKYAVVMGDLDHFKEINDTYGHISANGILKDVADIIRRCVRGGDLAYRYGGEEFVVLLPDASREEAYKVARRISNAIRSYQFTTVDGKPCREITMSLSAKSSEEPSEKGDILEEADEMMYAAKAYGRDFVISNVPTDIDTKIAGMPLFLPNLESLMARCNSPLMSEQRSSESGSVAVFIFDIVGFSAVIDKYKDRLAWSLFKDIAWWLYAERKSFDYVAKVYNRDQMIVSLASPTPNGDFLERVRGVADSYRQRLNNVVLSANGEPVKFDFAVGGLVYDPSRIVGRIPLLSDPQVLFKLSENMTDRACVMPERVNLKYYGD